MARTIDQARGVRLGNLRPETTAGGSTISEFSLASHPSTDGQNAGAVNQEKGFSPLWSFTT